MRAVSVRQPYAWLLASGWKDVENRSWHPSTTEWPFWLAVHAAKRAEPGMQLFYECDLGIEIPVVRSAIVGAILVDSVVCNPGASSSPWYEGKSGWVVRAAVLLREPVPDVAGALGCFRLPPEVHEKLGARWGDAEHRTWRTS